MGQGWVPLLLVSLVLVAVTVIVKRSYRSTHRSLR
jgi:hypothetical protein